MKKIILILILFLSIWFIYNNTVDEKINYLVLGNDLSIGEDNYSLYVKDYLAKEVVNMRNYKEEFEKRVDPHGRPYFWMTGRFLNQEPDAMDTDEAFLQQGYITVVPTKIDMTDYDFLKEIKMLNSDESR